jgi:AcrR family transcriptional regulator
MPQPTPKTSAIELTWVKPPQQQRSQQTLERLLEAAEALILEGGVDAASVAAVTKRARSSVGSFYTRFADRDSLLRAVCMRFGQEARATIDAVVRAERWQEHALTLVFETSIGFLFRVVRERRLLLTSLLAATPHDLELSQVMSGLGQHLAQRLHALLLARHELRGQAEPELAARALAAVLLSTAQARALAHLKDDALSDDRELGRELARMCVAYLREPVLVESVTSDTAKRPRNRPKIVRMRRRT